MSQDVLFQARLFAMAMIWGMGLMLAYDGLRLLRMFATHRRSVQAMEEIVFWLAASGIIYTLIYRYNSGAVRNYVVFGMASGMIFYRFLISPLIIRTGCMILRPVRDGIRIFKTFVKAAGKRLKSAVRGVTIKIRSVKHKKTGKQGDCDGS